MGFKEFVSCFGATQKRNIHKENSQKSAACILDAQ
jgi:hypothetical protein